MTNLRRIKGLFTLYSVLLYSGYSAVILLGFSSRTPLKVSGLVLSPFVIWLFRRLIQWWYNRLLTSNQEKLKELQVQQKEKIEEFKVSTNFYSAQALLKRFDESFEGSEIPNGSDKPNLNANNSQESNQNSAVNAIQAQTTGSPGRGTAAGPAVDTGSDSNLLQSPPDMSFSPFSAIPVITQPIAPYQPHWYDRILDLIVGENELGPNARYALICQRCKSHNGLAYPGENPDDVVYICPRCGYRNGGKREIEPENKEAESNIVESIERGVSRIFDRSVNAKHDLPKASEPPLPSLQPLPSEPSMPSVPSEPSVPSVSSEPSEPPIVEPASTSIASQKEEDSKLRKRQKAGSTS